ncbi:MAG: cache domain-containing protein [Anaerolineales bacterium]|jgi:two-component system NtrC family sensor kinase
MIRDWVANLFGGQLRVVLIVSFSLVAAFTVGLGAVTISRVIQNYLKSAEAARVDRDMELANAFYKLKLDETAAISHRLVLDKLVTDNLQPSSQGRAEALKIIDQQITNKITVLALGGTHFIIVFDADGNIMVSRVLTPGGYLLQAVTSGNWLELPILDKVLKTGEDQSATEIIPAEFLKQIGLEEQAQITLIDTPKASEKPFDPREGTAGLALTSVSTVKNKQGEVEGAVLAAYMFNNDFTLVDRIKEVAGVDTVTIFFGDLRVSTNVMTADNKRAVGTRVSQEVYDVVLVKGEDYVGEAFVVNDTYITRYKPLRNHMGQVVGSLYVGALKSTFQALADAFSKQVLIIAALSILLAGIIATPIAQTITKPVTELVQANQRLAQGDMRVKVDVHGSGEIAVLGHSFNRMVEELDQAQKELLQKEKLASMGQLAAGVAHEINNPLGTILLFADMLYKEMPDDDPRRSDLKMIIEETTRCKSIVSDLLNFSRQKNITAQDINIQDLIDQVIEGLQAQSTLQDVRFVREFDSNMPTIRADPNQLKQVFINLFKNGAEAMEAEGIITVSTKMLDHNWIEINISDTGAGIPEEHLDKIFSPFFTTKSNDKGTGLGLSIVYGIIKMHRGQIKVVSQLGKGTTFTITLPVNLPEGLLSTADSAADTIT